MRGGGDGVGREVEIEDGIEEEVRVTGENKDSIEN